MSNENTPPDTKGEQDEVDLRGSLFNSLFIVFRERWDNHFTSDECNMRLNKLLDEYLAASQAREQGREDEYEIACNDVLKEVRRAKTMFKENFVNQHEGYAVLLEEVDELWDEVKKNQKVYDLEKQRKEVIQAAAMCIRFAAELTPSRYHITPKQ